MKVGYLVVLSLALLAARPAIAASVRVDFSGTIDEVNGELGALGGSIGVGTTFSGYFTFDDSTAPMVDDPEQLPDPESGFSGYWAWAGYFFTSPDTAFHFEVGTVTGDATVPNLFSPTGGYTIDVLDLELNPTPDLASLVYVDAIVGAAPLEPGTVVWLERVELALSGGEPGLPLHSTTLASVPWSLLEFPVTEVLLSFNEIDDNYPWALGTVDELTVSVPEPATAALAAGAALALTVLGFARARS